eukprot:2675352-Amphidinium_carterae.1
MLCWCFGSLGFFSLVVLGYFWGGGGGTILGSDKTHGALRGVLVLGVLTLLFSMSSFSMRAEEEKEREMGQHTMVTKLVLSTSETWRSGQGRGMIAEAILYKTM